LPNRQADAAFAAGLFQESDSAALRFDSQDDALNFAKHCVENGRRRFRAGVLAVLKRYVDSDLYLVIKAKAPLDAGVWDFVFRAIPDGGLVEFDGASPSRTSDFGCCCRASNEGDQRMFAQVAHVVESPEKIIPSLVWLERSKERSDFRWDILRDTPHAILEICGGIGEGEHAKLQVGVAGREVGGRPRGVIETGPQVFNDFGRENAPTERESLGYESFVDFVSSVRISLNNSGVWLFSEKAVNLGFEIIEMFLCAPDSQFSAVEGIKLHDQQT
jgi:hypothetical protein